MWQASPDGWNSMKSQEPAGDFSAINALSQTTPLEEPSPRLRTRYTLAGSDSGSSGSGSSRFQIKKVLGSGSFGTVSLAWDATLKREVAIKRPADAANYGAKQTFLHEAQLAARIKHPGVVVVHDFGLDELGDPFVVYEYLPGQNLRDRMAAGAFTICEVLSLAISLAEALVAVHKEGLTHRDLKPANILLDEDDQPHIADFGLAVCDETQFEKYGEVAGTYRYMAPEQVRGEANLVDGRTDLWALGVIIYQLLTGHYPFPGDSKLQIFEQVLEREPRPLRQWNAKIPAQLEDIVLKLVAKPIEERFGSASDLAASLRECRQSLDQLPAAVEVAQPRTRAFGAMRAGALVILMLILVVGLASGFSAYQRREQGPAQPEKRETLPPLPVGIWTPLLATEPAALMIHPEDRVSFAPGELSVAAEYQATLRLGEVWPDDFSFRITYEPETWNAQAGIFIGGQPGTERPDSERMTLIGVRQVQDQGVVVARVMHFQATGRQLPLHTHLIGGVEMITLENSGSTAELQVDVEQGRIARLFLNSRAVKFAPSKMSTAPAQGLFGVYVLGGKCKFTNAEVRITKREKP